MITLQEINIGIADKGNGDPLRNAFNKVNINFNRVRQALQSLQGIQSSNGVQGLQGITGYQGIQGVGGTITSYVFDGGSPSTNFTLGPAFDCGGVD